MLPRWFNGKESTRQCRSCGRRALNPSVRKIPWRRKWQPTLVFLSGKFHGQKSLVGYSPWNCKEPDTAEHTCTHTHTHTHIYIYAFVLSCSIVFNSLWPPGFSPTMLLCPWDFQVENTRVGCHFLLQGIFLTQGSNLCLLHLLHWQADSLLLSHLDVLISSVIWC